MIWTAIEWLPLTDRKLRPIPLGRVSTGRSIRIRWTMGSHDSDGETEHLDVLVSVGDTHTDTGQNGKDGQTDGEDVEHVGVLPCLMG